MRADNFERREIRCETPDLVAIGLDHLLAHPPLVILEANTMDTLNGAPITLLVELHWEGDSAEIGATSLTIEEMTELRNYLNEAIVWAERSAA